MIAMGTRSSKLCRLFSNFWSNQTKKSLFSRCKNSSVVCLRGYIVTSNLHQLFNKSSTVKKPLLVHRFHFGSQNNYSTEEDPREANFVKLSTETLESLSEYFDELIDDAAHLQDADVSYGDGVLTIKFGNEYGTYVINRQVPNQQIWLSSPKSGPKRYDFIDGLWVYKHDGKTLHDLLSEEIPEIIKHPVSFSKCLYSGKDK